MAGLLVAAVVVWMREPASAGRRAYGVVWAVLVVLGGIVLTLPFWLDFDAAARGIGRVTEHDSFAHWAGDQALIYGIVAWLAVAAYASRVLATSRPLRTALWSAVAAAFVLSLLAPVELSGIALLLALVAVAIHALLSTRLVAAERFLWVLLAGAAGCVLLPELIYVRDEFDGSDLYRMNTVFKMGYQAYLLLGIAGACAIPWAGRWLPRRAWAGWATVTTILVLLGLVFPYAGNYARREGFSRTPDARRPRLAARQRARRRRGDRVAARQRARRRGRARGGRAGLLGLRPRADVHVHRPPDGPRMGRPRGPVEARPGHARGRRQDDVHVHRPGGGAAAARPLRRGVRRRRADRARRLRRGRGWPSGTTSAAACSTATAPRSGYWGRAARRM